MDGNATRFLPGDTHDSNDQRTSGRLHLPLLHRLGHRQLGRASRLPATDVLSVCTSLSALVLGVTLYALTREQDSRPRAARAGLSRHRSDAWQRPGHGGDFFAVGSTLFCWLLLCARMIPAPLAWLGVMASALLVIVLLAQRAGLFGGAVNWSSSMTWLVWLPALVFEIVLAFWLLIKGVAPAKATL